MTTQVPQVSFQIHDYDRFLNAILRRIRTELSPKNIELILQYEVIDGKIIPIESTSLLLAGAQSVSWMIPLVLSGIGIGLFVFRKSENSQFR